MTLYQFILHVWSFFFAGNAFHSFITHPSESAVYSSAEYLVELSSIQLHYEFHEHAAQIKKEIITGSNVNELLRVKKQTTNTALG